MAEQGGDVVFALDQSVEELLVDFVDQEIASHEPVVLVAEGLPGGQLVLPEGTQEQDCRWRLVVDPIDGTRLLMFQKRSGWALTALAPNRGPQTRLSDVCLAVQTEIPTLKQHLCDQLWALRRQGAEAIRYNRLSDESQPLELHPSRASTVYFGYSSITRFFPGARDILGAIDDEVIRGALGPQPPDGTLCFEDQYPSTGGQLYSLLSGCGSVPGRPAAFDGWHRCRAERNPGALLPSLRYLYGPDSRRVGSSANVLPKRRAVRRAARRGDQRRLGGLCERRDSRPGGAGVARGIVEARFDNRQ